MPGVKTKVGQALLVLATLLVVAAIVSGAQLADGSAGVAAAGLVAVATGWVIMRRLPTSLVGPALAWSSGAIAAVLLGERVVPAAAVGLWPVNLVGLFALLLVFPDGPSKGRGWRALPWIYGLATMGTMSGSWGSRQVDGKIVGEPSLARQVTDIVSTLTIGACLVLAVACVMGRYRRGASRQREQIRWLIAAGAVSIALLMAGWFALGLGASVEASFAPFLLAIVVLVPVAVAIAVVRHDLFDVDRLMGQSAIWFVTVVLSAGLFGVVVLALSDVVSRYTGLVGAAAASVTALSLLPLHRFLTEFVGRVVDRDRYVGLAAVKAFAADVHAGRREPEEIQQVLRAAQGDPDLQVLLARPGGGWITMDGTPHIREGFTVEVGGEIIAHIVLGWNSARARRRIADLAKAAWVPIEVGRLRLGLRDALAEAQASSARLADAGALERRRLVRDLHDGAQQRIVASGLRLRLLQQDLSGRAASEVEATILELKTTVDVLRRLANGVHPNELDDGLEAALVVVRDTTPIPFSLEVGQLPAVDDTRALTAYLVVSEAVANVLKHADASQIDVRVDGAGSRLMISVADNGIGGVPTDAPLPALRDRVLSVGGDLSILSPCGEGTTITAVL
jgi:signal transduction histidine kinase